MGLHLSIFFVLQCSGLVWPVSGFSPLPCWDSWVWSDSCCWPLSVSTSHFLKTLLSVLLIHSLCVTQHTFTDAHPIPEDLCSVLRESKLLKWNGTQLSLNQAEDESKNSYRAPQSQRIQTIQFIKICICSIFLFNSDWINLPVHFHLTGFDLSFNGKPGKSDSYLLHSIMSLFHSVVMALHHRRSDLMVILFLSLFKVFRDLFSFILNWMSLNSLLFDTNLICT